MTLTDVGLFADGTAVKLVGEETFRLARALVDDYVVVDTDAVCAAIKDVFQDTRSIVEPAGAMGVAAMKQYVRDHKLKGKTFVAITCGANMNFDRLRFVAERAEVRRAARGAVRGDHPRGARQLQALLRADRHAPGGPRNVTEFNYRIADTTVAHVFVGLTTRGKTRPAASRATSAPRLRHGGPDDDELAKEHVRHMVGGHSELARDERLFRFVFPERPGALMRFLSSMHPGWNISLFHYRNQGADYGRILVGIQVPKADDRAFKSFLRTLAYP